MYGFCFFCRETKHAVSISIQVSAALRGRRLEMLHLSASTCATPKIANISAHYLSGTVIIYRLRVSKAQICYCSLVCRPLPSAHHHHRAPSSSSPPHQHIPTPWHCNCQDGFSSASHDATRPEWPHPRMSSMLRNVYVKLLRMALICQGSCTHFPFIWIKKWEWCAGTFFFP